LSVLTKEQADELFNPETLAMQIKHEQRLAKHSYGSCLVSKILKKNQDSLINRIFGHMHEALNIDKK
jgi:Icc-related predicted phosphoesterase